jgi:hypothetical protein
LVSVTIRTSCLTDCSARGRIFDQIEDERVSQEKLVEERLKKRQQRLAQYKELENERLQFADEIRYIR